MSDTTNPDEYAGQGGSYVLDPVTGIRTLVSRTQDDAEAAPAAPEFDAPDAAPKD